VLDVDSHGQHVDALGRHPGQLEVEPRPLRDRDAAVDPGGHRAHPRGDPPVGRLWGGDVLPHCRDHPPAGPAIPGADGLQRVGGGELGGVGDVEAAELVLQPAQMIERTREAEHEALPEPGQAAEHVGRRGQAPGGQRQAVPLERPLPRSEGDDLLAEIEVRQLPRVEVRAPDERDPHARHRSAILPRMATDVRATRREAYESPRPDVQALVPAGARRILDLGCASGELGAALKRRQGAEVIGVELDPVYARDAEQHLDRVLCGDVEATLRETDDLGRFDCVIAADVLEHLVDPWSALRHAADLLEPGGTAIVSLPNVRYLLTYWRLVRDGRWPREPAGPFDATHLRWFTPLDARELLEQAGLAIERERPNYFFSGRVLRVAKLLGRTPLVEFLAGQWVLEGRRAG
jgi:methionine biosynthesis protein MetW